MPVCIRADAYAKCRQEVCSQCEFDINVTHFIRVTNCNKITKNSELYSHFVKFYPKASKSQFR